MVADDAPYLGAWLTDWFDRIVGPYRNIARPLLLDS